MGLSSKEVSSDDGHDFMIPKPSSSSSSSSSSKQDVIQSEPLKCPRCESTNTKFCYYNNHKKSQPRHICKACKRHWTQGGTLRTVPLGGGRKNKRKVSKPATPKTTTMTIQPQILPQTFYQTLGVHPLPESSISFRNNGVFTDYPYSNLGSLEQSNPCSISSIQSPDYYNFTGDQADNNLLEMNTNLSENLYQQQISWSIGNNNSSNFMGNSSNWGWDDFDEGKLTIPWDDDHDDADIKP